MALLALATIGNAASAQPTDVGRDKTIAAMHSAAAELARPLSMAERFPALRFLAYLVADEVEPHLRAISDLARTGESSAAIPLLKVLEDESFPYRFEVGVALQDVPNPRSISALSAVIDEGDPRLSRMAARVLGVVAGKLETQLQTDSLSPQQIAALKLAVESASEKLSEVAATDPNPVLRVAALSGLISLGTREALRAVYEIGISDPHEMVRCRLLSATGEFMTLPREAKVAKANLRSALRKSLDPVAIDHPVGVVMRAYYGSIYFSKVEPEGDRRSDCIDANQTAMWWLASLNDPAAIPHLLRAAESTDPALHATAGWGLPRFNDARAFEQATELLASPYWGVRNAAIEGFGRSKHPGADAELLRVLQTGTRLDRREAAKALAGSFGASLPLIEAFADRAVEVRNEAEGALLRSDEVVEKLRASLDRISDESETPALERRRHRIEAGLARWEHERSDAEAALAHGLAAEDPRVRIRSARVLSRYNSTNSLRLSIEVLASGNSPANAAAALSLGLRGDVAARAPLERAAGSDDEDLSVAAIRALQDLRAQDSLPRLRELGSHPQNDRVAEAIRYAVAILERDARGRASGPVGF